jgi:DNA-directed RNA polymerase specialized sigma24 family protein
MTTTEFESSQAISMDTWKTACAITESEQEAEDLVQNIFDEVHHLPDNQQSIAVMMHINLLASKVMTRH